LFKKEDPLSPSNRRISLIIMNKKAEEAASHDGGTVGIEAGTDTEEIKDTIHEGVQTLPAAQH
jgi:chemotaxis protein MotB